MSENRIVEKKIKNKWVRIDFMELKKGDIFRLFEPNMEIVKDLDGNEKYIAECDAFRINGVGTIEIDYQKGRELLNNNDGWCKYETENNI